MRRRGHRWTPTTAFGKHRCRVGTWQAGAADGRLCGVSLRQCRQCHGASFGEIPAHRQPWLSRPDRLRTAAEPCVEWRATWHQPSPGCDAKDRPGPRPIQKSMRWIRSLDSTRSPGPLHSEFRPWRRYKTRRVAAGEGPLMADGVPRQVRQGARWEDAYRSCRQVAPETHRELLALLLVWEIGKPWRQALTSVDRTSSGVRWYLEAIEPMVAGRQPLPGPVSNIASWNYPLSVLAHAMLVQLLAGNAVIAKTPTDGGLCALTLAAALMRRCDLPVTLISGSGSRLSPALVLHAGLGCLAFVGGRDVGGPIASPLVQTDKRHMLEQEGLNAWGIWDFSDWDTLAAHLKKGFEYGKQRCTAYPRYVVQRTLFDQFLAMYLQVVRSLSFGHPLAVADPDDQPPELDFGPLINAAKVDEPTGEVDLAIRMAATPLF